MDYYNQYYNQVDYSQQQPQQYYYGQYHPESYQHHQYYNNLQHHTSLNASEWYGSTSSPSDQSSLNDSAYASQYQIPTVVSHKRKYRDDFDEECGLVTASGNVDAIVNQIFTDAASAQASAAYYESQQLKKPSKRPKIFKLEASEGDSNVTCLKCNQCDLTFNSQAKQLMHQYKYHSNGSSTECPICYKRFGNQANALVHLRAHTQEKTYKCTFCNNAFCDSSTLKKHLRTHTGEKPYECTLCLKRFTQSGNLKRHLTVHAKYPAEHFFPTE